MRNKLLLIIYSRLLINNKQIIIGYWYSLITINCLKKLLITLVGYFYI